MATTKEPKQKLVYSPGEAAELLHMTTRRLGEIIRERRHPFTEISPGGRPGDRGHNRWGLTWDQIQAIVRGLAKVTPDLTTIQAEKSRPSPASPDGKSRLRRSPVRR